MCRAAWPLSTSPRRRSPHRQTLCRRPVLPRGLPLPTPPIGPPGISSCVLYLLVVFWQALYGRRCPTVMSTVSRLMSRFVRDNQQDTGVRLMPTCAHGVCTDGGYLGGAKEHCDRSRCQIRLRIPSVLGHSPLLPSARNHVSGGAPSRRTRSNLKLL